MKTQKTQIRLTALFAISLLMLIQYAANAQSTVRRNVNGNFQAVTAQEAKHDSATTFTYTDGKGKTEPVYKGKKGIILCCPNKQKVGEILP